LAPGILDTLLSDNEGGERVGEEEEEEVLEELEAEEACFVKARHEATEVQRRHL
jgi:hypothetical protein